MGDFYKEARELHEKEKYEEALKLYEQGIAAGDEKCWYGYGMFLKEGHALAQDEEKGAQILKEHYDKILALANSGDAAAMRIVGFYYYNGYAIEADESTAFQWFEKSANVGDVGAMENLGRFYENGWSVEQNFEEAVKWYTKSAEQGDAVAQHNIGVMYYNGQCVEQNYEEAIKWYTKSAEQGYAGAQCNLGVMYYKGQGVEQSYEEAVKWYTKSAEQGDAVAQYNLGVMYYNGQGVEQNYEEAIKWYTKSAEQGDADAQYNLGVMYDNGQGVEQNYEEAIKWYTKSAEQGDAVAQYNLGVMYDNGRGVEQSYERARHWYEQAASNGTARAYQKLGILYECGYGVELSPDKAVELWEKACEIDAKDCSGASYKLGYAYYDGFGVKRDLGKALEYFNLAYNSGYSCSYAIDMVQNELARATNKSRKNANDNNLMRNYAEGIVSKKIPIEKMYPRVLKDLKSDFGNSWDKLQSNSQKFLSTSVVCYIALYSMGKHIYGNMDFTSSITPMIKSLELEMGKYLYTGYINYLNENNVPISSFSSKRSFIKCEGPYSFRYYDPDDLSEFTLGSIHLVIGFDKNTQIRSGMAGPKDFSGKNVTKHGESREKASIDKPMLDYLKSIFDAEAFGDLDLDRAITDYIVDLSTEIKSITDSFRNPAAHSNVMSCSKAEACANALIKAKKIICKFVEKIKV